MNRFVSRWAAAAMLLMMASAATAQNVTVQQTGTPSATNFVGVDGIRDAVMAVTTGNEVQVLDAGTYSSVTLVGGKTYTVRGMVDGVVISNLTNTNAAAVRTSASTGSNVDVSLVNLDIINTSGSTGVAMHILQHTTGTTTVSMNDCLVQHAALSGGANAFQIQGASVVDSGLVSLTANNTRFEALTTGTGRNAFLMGGGTNRALNGISVSLTSCSLYSVFGTVLNWGTDANDMTWVIDRCRLEVINPNRQAGFNVDRAVEDSNITIVDTFIQCSGEVIRMNNKTWRNNNFTVNRSTFSNARFGSNDFTGNTNVRLRFTNDANEAPTNAVNFYNTVIVQSPKAGAFEHFSRTTTTLIHCTIVKELGQEGVANNSAISNQNPGGSGGESINSRLFVYNTIFAGDFGQGMMPGGVPNENKRGNLIANDAFDFVDDTDVGDDRTTGSVTQLNFWATGLIPQSPSIAINNAYTSAPLLAAIGYVDRNKAARWLSNAPHEVGAFESFAIGVPVELSNFEIE